jgi:nicotinamide riboside kinase
MGWEIILQPRCLSVDLEHEIIFVRFDLILLLENDLAYFASKLKMS